MRILEVLGNGSIEQRGKDKWRLKLTVLYADRKKDRITKDVSARNKTEAKKHLQRWRLELLKGAEDYSNRKVKVDEMLDIYLDFCRNDRGLALSTLRGYRGIADRYLRPTIGHRYLHEITPLEIENLMKELSASGGLDGRPLSGHSCKQIKNVLSPMFKRAMFLQYIPSNPCVSITMPPTERIEMSILSEVEAQRMIKKSLGHPDYRFPVVIRLALATGCRRGELCGLRWEDVNFERSTLHIRHSLSEVEKKDAIDGEVLHLKDTKTCENRNINIDAQTMRLLKEHKTLQGHKLAYNDYVQTPKTAVFSGAFGEWYRPSVLSKTFEVFASRFGFMIRLHDVRHTHASILIMNGENIVSVSKRLGHAKVSITLDTYSHLMPGQDAAVAARIGELLTEELPVDEDGGAPQEKFLRFVSQSCPSGPIPVSQTQ